MSVTCRSQLIRGDFITRIIFGEEYTSLSPSLCSFLQSHVTSSLLGPNTLLSTLFSNTLSLRPTLQLWDQVSHPYKTTGKNIWESTSEYICVLRFANFSQIRRNMYITRIYTGADKSLARPRRKQANVSVRMAWISFGALPCRKKKNLMTARVSMSLKSRASLTFFQASFLPGRAKNLSAPR